MASALWSMPVLRLVATDRCRVAAPWFKWARPTDPTARLKKLAVHLERNRLPRVSSFEQAIAALIYLPLSLVAIAGGIRRWGHALGSSYGFSRMRQFTHLLKYSWRLGVSPRMYYQMRLHRHPWNDVGRFFLDQPELHHLQRHLAPADIEVLEDKLKFDHKARAGGLPCVPIYAVWSGGTPRAAGGETLPESLPRENLFVKPVSSYSSSGVMGFSYDRTTRTFQGENRSWTEHELLLHLRHLSATRDLLVQPWLKNRQDIAAFSTGALCNVRLVTGRYPNGKIVPIMGAFRFPWKSKLSCAEPGITLCSGIDLETGRMHAAEAKDPALGRLERHPVSRQLIDGFVFPDWREMVAIGEQAHRVWPDFAFIGWDLALTDLGTFILEGSCLWGGNLAQMSGSRPLGLTAFPEIYFANLAAKGSAVA
jgi:hypothetical protein